MGLVASKSANVLMLKLILNQATPSDVVLRLYTNDYEPAEDDTALDYEECEADGYAPITLDGDSWLILEGDISGAIATFDEQTFSLSSGASIHGYFMTNIGGDNLYWSEAFPDRPLVLPGIGGVIKITPVIQCD